MSVEFSDIATTLYHEPLIWSRNWYQKRYFWPKFLLRTKFQNRTIFGISQLLFSVSVFRQKISFGPTLCNVRKFYWRALERGYLLPGPLFPFSLRPPQSNGTLRQYEVSASSWMWVNTYSRRRDEEARWRRRDLGKEGPHTSVPASHLGITFWHFVANNILCLLCSRLWLIFQLV